MHQLERSWPTMVLNVASVPGQSGFLITHGGEHHAHQLERSGVHHVHKLDRS